MPQKETIRVKGLRDFLRATSKAEKSTKKEIRSKLAGAGDIVRRSAEVRFRPVSVHSASRFRTRVRVAGVDVEQSLRKTTGLRPDYGDLQMRRALIPALQAHSMDVEKSLERAVDELADILEG